MNDNRFPRLAANGIARTFEFVHFQLQFADVSLGLVGALLSLEIDREQQARRYQLISPISIEIANRRHSFDTSPRSRGTKPENIDRWVSRVSAYLFFGLK